MRLLIGNLQTLRSTSGAFSRSRIYPRLTNPPTSRGSPSTILSTGNAIYTVHRTRVSSRAFTTASGHQSKPSRAPRWIPYTLLLLPASILILPLSNTPLKSDDSRSHIAPPSIPSDPLNLLDPTLLNQSNLHIRSIPLRDLFRMYIIFSVCSSPTIVGVTPWILDKLVDARSVLPFGIGEGVWSLAREVMKTTFFHHFVGGETSQDCKPLIESLSSKGCGTLLTYSVEANDVVDSKTPGDDGLERAHLEETMNAIREAAKVGGGGRLVGKGGEGSTVGGGVTIPHVWIAIKLTGLLDDPTVLERASSALTSSTSYQRGESLPSTSAVVPQTSPLLDDRDIMTLQGLREELRKICREARELGGVRLVVDAEQTWFQPAVDRFYDILAEEFNRPSPNLPRPNSSFLRFFDFRTSSPASPPLPPTPLLYNTYQAYLHTTPSKLHSALQRSKSLGYSLGVKIVRGAYMESERARVLERGGKVEDCEVWSTKKGSDECYDGLVRELVYDLRERLGGGGGGIGLGVMVAGHNAVSVRRTLENLREVGLARTSEDGTWLEVSDDVRGRLCFGQLMGMADNLTSTLLSILPPPTVDADGKRKDPLVIKYVPYGSVDEVIPYLVRRAQENKAVLDGPGGARDQRRMVGREIRRRLGWTWD